MVEEIKLEPANDLEQALLGLEYIAKKVESLIEAEERGLIKHQKEKDRIEEERQTRELLGF